MHLFSPFHWLRLAFLGLTSALVLSAAPSAPKLVVAISIDQFRRDYLDRFRDHFSPGGFNLFLEKGADFADCHYRHSLTVTGPGHAVILSGTYANIHGIIANEWTDRSTFIRQNCVEDRNVQIVGLPPAQGAGMPGVTLPIGRSPRNYLVTTVGDELKLARGNQPKVIGISNKDRSAILMSGHLSNAAYWLDRGHVVTSTYYMQELPAWVREFDAPKKIAAYYGRTWDRLLPEAAYTRQGPDDAPGEYESKTVPRTLPKPIANFADFGRSPFSLEFIGEFARVAAEKENLGRRGVTDVLCVSFSSIDTVGHAYGPDSHEMMDMVVRMDRVLESFFNFLDRHVGLAHCTFVLTADHGAPPLPERIQVLNPHLPTGRIDAARALNAGEAALVEAFGALPSKKRWLVSDGPWLLFTPEAFAEKKVDRVRAEQVVRDALLGIDFVQAVYTRSQLEAGAVFDALGQRALLSFNQQRSGDVFYQTKPYYFAKGGFGITHGTPHNYDTHVPMLWYGVGIKPGVYHERTGVDDIAPTLARILGLPAPPRSEGRVLF